MVRREGFACPAVGEEAVKPASPDTAGISWYYMKFREIVWTAPGCRSTPSWRGCLAGIARPPRRRRLCEPIGAVARGPSRITPEIAPLQPRRRVAEVLDHVVVPARQEDHVSTGRHAPRRLAEHGLPARRQSRRAVREARHEERDAALLPVIGCCCKEFDRCIIRRAPPRSCRFGPCDVVGVGQSYRTQQRRLRTQHVEVRSGWCLQEFLENLVRIVRTSPQWDRSMLVITYDEHGTTSSAGPARRIGWLSLPLVAITSGSVMTTCSIRNPGRLVCRARHFAAEQRPLHGGDTQGAVVEQQVHSHTLSDPGQHSSGGKPRQTCALASWSQGAVLRPISPLLTNCRAPAQMVGF